MAFDPDAYLAKKSANTTPAGYGARPDGTPKGSGYLGEIQLPGGSVATEYSVQSEAVRQGGQRIDFPTLVPTLTPQEVELMRTKIIPGRMEIPEPIMQKAIAHARSRLSQGKSPFADAAPAAFDPDAYLAKKAAPAEQAPNPTEGMGTGELMAAGAGKAVTDLGRGAQQTGLQIAEGLQGIEDTPLKYIPTAALMQWVAEKSAGDKPAIQQKQAEIQGQIDEAAVRDAPLMETGAGKAGYIGGSVAAAAPTMFIPGVNTYTGAATVGALTGGLQPTTTEEGDTLTAKAKNTVIGGVAGMAGQAVGQGIGAIARSYAARKATEKAAQKAAGTIKDATAKSAQKAGYTIPPVQVNPTAANRLLEGFAGKITTGQSASIKNQSVTNNLVKKAIGLAPDEQLTPQALSAVRAEAGKAYEAIRGAGVLQADAQYADDLAKIVSKYQGAGKDFPELAKNEIADSVEMINKQGFDSSSALDAVAILRDKADKAFRGGDKAFGKAYKQMADAMEGVMERNIAAAGDDAAQLLNDFRQSRQLIAKTYTIESALNASTGNVNAKKLAQMLAKGKPLSGEIKQAAQFAQAFPKAAEEITSSMPGVSPLDYATAGIGAAASGNPGLLASIMGRPVVRGTILSQPYQRMMVNPPTYGPNMLEQSANLLDSKAVNALLRMAPGSAYAAEK